MFFMKKWLPLLALCTISILQAQNAAYYLTNYQNNADIVLFNQSLKNYGTKKAFKFSHTVSELTLNGKSYLPRIFNKPIPFPKSTATNSNRTIKGPGGSIYSKIDSFNVSNKWYQIYMYEFDDGFVGGRPNQIDRYVLINGIGLIYSESNFQEGHLIYMLCHQDSVKQRVLTMAYNYLYKQCPWQDQFNQLPSLVSKYKFQNCIRTLTKHWMENTNQLLLVGYSLSSVNQLVKYSVTIKNGSNRGLFLPDYTQIGPSKATIQYYDSTSIDWDLIVNPNEASLKTLDNGLYLLPGQEVEVSHVFDGRRGCGNCKNVIYEGIQLKTNVTLSYMLLYPTAQKKSNTFYLYNLQKIKE